MVCMYCGVTSEDVMRSLVMMEKKKRRIRIKMPASDWLTWLVNGSENVLDKDRRTNGAGISEKSGGAS